MGEAIMVGMAEIKCTRTPENVLMAIGVASCICVCAFDPTSGIAAMAHVVLPESRDGESAPGKFADTAIPALVQAAAEAGAEAERLRFAIAGGAQIFAFHGNGARLEIGPRNAAAIVSALQLARLPLVGADVGGTAARTVRLMGDGSVRVKAAGKPEQELANLGAAETGGRTVKSAPESQTQRWFSSGLPANRHE